MSVGMCRLCGVSQSSRSGGGVAVRPCMPGNAIVMRPQVHIVSPAAGAAAAHNGSTSSAKLKAPSYPTACKSTVCGRSDQCIRCEWRRVCVAATAARGQCTESVVILAIHEFVMVIRWFVSTIVIFFCPETNGSSSFALGGDNMAPTCLASNDS